MASSQPHQAIEATWTLCTPRSGAGGALAVMQVQGDVDGAFAAMQLAPLRVGQVVVRDVMGVDTCVVARWSASCAALMPHAGRAVVEAMTRAMTARGILEAVAPAPWEIYPEARSEVEARALVTLSHAPSRLAVAKLLAQHDAWASSSQNTDRARDAMLRRLLDPPLVVAVGASNIGKSSLLNALAKRTVAIVADEAGTTRDHVGVMLELAGLVVRWVDTPGMRETQDEEELRARALAMDLALRADLLVLCGDAEHPPIAMSPAPASVLRVALRADRGMPAWTYDLAVSVVKQQGLEVLVAQVRERLVPQAMLDDPAPWRFWDAPPP